MKLGVNSGKIESLKTEGLIFFIFEKEDLSKELIELDKRLDDWISSIIKDKYFSGSEKEIHSIYTHKKIVANKIILVGLGERKKYNLEKLRRATASAIKFASANFLKNVTIVLPETNPETNNDIIKDIGIVALMSVYQFEHYKTKKENKKGLSEINFYINKDASQYKSILGQASIIGEAINWTRDIINHPSNFITPKILARHAKELSDINVKIRVLGEKEMKKLGMGLLLGVSRGSDEEAQFIILDYKSKNYKNTLVFVGKGLTFDSGGISIKPSSKMDEMKMDMAGAGTVLGTMKAVAKLKPNIRIIGLIPASENMPSGKALKPGDILTSMSGTTVEVIDTDAEGRLVLGDALFYAQQYKPSAIIDLATLTGACLVALGNEAAGLLGNNDKLINKIKESGERTGERVWELPLWDDYKDQIKSDIADIKNLGEGRLAGTITGAAFLEKFVGNYPWAHLDIACTAFSDKKKSYHPQIGGTGYGVRLLIDVIENFNLLTKK